MRSCSLSNRLLNLEKLLLKLFVTFVEGAALVALAILAKASVAVAIKVLTIKKIRLMAETAGYPLPTEMVASGIAI